MKREIVIRDHRNKAMFRVDDAYLNGYARLCGDNATLVYLCLCRHTDSATQESFPSQETMARKIGKSRDSVVRGVKELLKWNIISVERTRRQNQTWLCNTYTLLDKSVWKPKPCSTGAHGSPSSEIADTHAVKEPTYHVAPDDTKDAHSKDSHNKNAEASSAVLANSFFQKNQKDNDAPMDVNEFFEMCSESPYRFIRIIGDFASEKRPQISTKGGWRRFGLRNMRTAKRLEPYTDNHLEKALSKIHGALKVNGGYLREWGLETIEKYLDKI